jgi:hypothetical protein
MNINFEGTKYNLLNLVNVINISINNKHVYNNKNSDNLIILALDKSGSMVGKPFDEAKNAIIKLVENLHETHKFIMIAYAGYKKTYTEFYDWKIKSNNYKMTKGNPDVINKNFTNKSKDEIISTISDLKAGGQTSFEVAFNTISSCLSVLINKPKTSILFFTDGEDTDSLNKHVIDTSLKKLIELINTKTSDPQIHCLGFTSQHDAQFLGNLSSSINNSTFQYIENIHDIEKKIINLIPLIDKNTVCAKLHDELTDEEYDIIFKDTDENKTSTIIYLPLTLISDIFTIRGYPEEDSIYPVMLNTIEMDLSLHMDDVINLISRWIAEKTNIMIKEELSGEILMDINSKFKYMEDELNNVKSEIDKIKIRPKKNTLMKKYLIAKDNVAKFLEFYRKAIRGNIENEDVARMFDIAYRGEIKKGLQKKLDKRFSKNYKLYEKLYDELEIDANNDKTKSEEYLKKYKKELDNISNCFYSTSNAIELMGEGDCLCICLQVSRKQEAIADPSKINILAIHPSMLSAGSFQEAYEHALKSVDITKVKNIHGGFTEKDGIVIYGQGREKINAVMPIYLFPEHWKYAKKWFKVITGLVTTLDPFGYIYEQYITFPFLVLHKMMHMNKKNNNKINNLLLKLITNTCMTIYNESEVLQKRTSDNLKQYITNGDNRTIDGINNNSLFIMHIYIGQLTKHISKLKDNEAIVFIQRMIEEEARRTQQGNKENILNIDIFLSIINQDKEKWIDEEVNTYKKNKDIQIKKNQKNTKYKTDLYKDLENTGLLIEMDSDSDEEYLETIPITKKSDKWEGTINEMSETGKDLWNHSKNMYKKYAVNNIAHFIECIENKEVVVPIMNLENLTNEQKITFSLQNYLHYKNSLRRVALNIHTYKDPFDREQSKKFLKNKFVNFIENEKTQRINTIDNKYNSILSNVRAHTFAITNDIDVAAGALKGTFVGRNIMDFVKKLQTEDCPLALKKIEMILNGTHNILKNDIMTGKKNTITIQLYADCDKIRNPSWEPSKKNCFRIWKQNHECQNEQKWDEFFEWYNLKHSVKSWYKWYVYIKDDNEILHLY